MLLLEGRLATGTPGVQLTPLTVPAETTMLRLALMVGSGPALVQEKLNPEYTPAGLNEGGTLGAFADISATSVAANPPDSRETKASVKPPPYVPCAPPLVPGKSVEPVTPATYTSPVEEGARLVATWPPEPPSKWLG